MTESPNPSPSPSPNPNEYYEQLYPATDTVKELQEPDLLDRKLSTDGRISVRRLLYEISLNLEQARQVLPDTDPAAELDREDDEWETYPEAIDHLERRLTILSELATEEHPDEYRYTEAPKEKFDAALETLTCLRDVLPKTDPDDGPEVDFERTEKAAAYEHVSGRKQGDGRWLEYQLGRAFRRWGYIAETREMAFRLEVDVVAVREEKRHDPTDWLVAECKDWSEATITPGTIFRLCTVAFICRAMPVLCHTTELTTRAEQLARDLEVRVLELDDLTRGELPAPQVAHPSAELFEYSAEWTARDSRGTLPFMFRGDHSKHFSYVPGFEPVGYGCAYQPVDDDLDDDTHPATGH